MRLFLRAGGISAALREPIILRPLSRVVKRRSFPFIPSPVSGRISVIADIDQDNARLLAVRKAAYGVALPWARARPWQQRWTDNLGSLEWSVPSWIARACMPVTAK
jgi:hypothetical protein